MAGRRTMCEGQCGLPVGRVITQMGRGLVLPGPGLKGVSDEGRWRIGQSQQPALNHWEWPLYAISVKTKLCPWDLYYIK